MNTDLIRKIRFIGCFPCKKMNTEKNRCCRWYGFHTLLIFLKRQSPLPRRKNSGIFFTAEFTEVCTKNMWLKVPGKVLQRDEVIVVQEKSLNSDFHLFTFFHRT